MAKLMLAESMGFVKAGVRRRAHQAGSGDVIMQEPIDVEADESCACTRSQEGASPVPWCDFFGWSEIEPGKSSSKRLLYSQGSHSVSQASLRGA